MGVAQDNSDFIEIEKRAFLATNNAMHAWAAYSFARVVKAPPPDWVLRYFDLCAREIFSFAMDVAKSEKKGSNPGPRIAKALHLKGTDFKGYHSDWMTFGMNVRQRIQQDDKPYFAVESVANDAGVSKSTVRRAWELYDKAFGSGTV